MRYVSCSSSAGVNIRVILIERDSWDPKEDPQEDSRSIESSMQHDDQIALVAIKGKWTTGVVFFLGVRDAITELRMITANQAWNLLTSLRIKDETVLECLSYAHIEMGKLKER